MSELLHLYHAILSTAFVTLQSILLANPVSNANMSIPCFTTTLRDFPAPDYETDAVWDLTCSDSAHLYNFLSHFLAARNIFEHDHWSDLNSSLVSELSPCHILDSWGGCIPFISLTRTWPVAPWAWPQRSLPVSMHRLLCFLCHRSPHMNFNCLLMKTGRRKKGSV